MTTRVVVVGAGPAGMAAGSIAAENGCCVTLLDENPAPGGQLWRGAQSAKSIPPSHAPDFAVWQARLISSRVEIFSETSVVDNPAPNTLRVEHHGQSQDIHYDRLILATGARERFLPFPGWTLPGVFGVGGLQALVKGGLPIAGKRVVIAGSGPLLLAVGAGLTHAGAIVEGIFEQVSPSKLSRFALSLAALPAKLIEGAQYRWQTRRASYKPGWWVKRANGSSRFESVILTDGQLEREISCDYLASAFHLVPNLELPQLLGCKIQSGSVVVNAVQETSVRSVYCAGEPTGVGGLDKALVEGQIAGLAAAGQLGKAAQLLPLRQKLQRFAQLLDRTFALRPELRAAVAPNTIVCRCEDVTHAELARCGDGRAARLHTRCGMGPCQARICGPATEFLFGWTASSARPPVYPARIATLAASPAGSKSQTC
jgi:D-hydroxyproline dehydrogenase subunit alpha